MNGLEILTERIINPPIIMPIICIILLITLGILCLGIVLSGEAEDFAPVVMLFCVLSVSGSIGMIAKMSKDKPYTIYKVTPTQEEYYIDLDKYTILSKDGKIIELKEK